MSGFGIYIHWPYCLSKCPYCDFFSKVKKGVEQESIIAGYLEDLNFYHSLSADKTVSSIFFGGGTPSLLKTELIEKIINYIYSLWPMATKVEISLEANPNTDRPCLFKDLKSAGINRLSLGVQALNDADLKLLGRTHNAAQARQAISKVLETFDNHSIDLIYARPEQNLIQWEKELKEAVSFGFKHLSLYQLTIEEGTVFYKKGLTALAEDVATEMYNQTNKLLESSGYRQYEISNYAHPGFESMHNSLYWQGDDYLGIGEAAHGRLQTANKFYATTHHRKFEELTVQERAEELLLMGLRLNRGIDKAHFKANCGLDFDDFVNGNKLSILTEQGFIIDSKDNIRVSDSGRPVLNKIIEELCP